MVVVVVGLASASPPRRRVLWMLLCMRSGLSVCSPPGPATTADQGWMLQGPQMMKVRGVAEFMHSKCVTLHSSACSKGRSWCVQLQKPGWQYNYDASGCLGLTAAAMRHTFRQHMMAWNCVCKAVSDVVALCDGTAICAICDGACKWLMLDMLTCCSFCICCRYCLQQTQAAASRLWCCQTAAAMQRRKQQTQMTPPGSSP